MKKNYFNEISSKISFLKLQNFSLDINSKISLFLGIILVSLGLFLPQISNSSEDSIAYIDVDNPKELAVLETSNTTIGDILIANEEKGSSLVAPGFSMVFSPATIGPGSVTTLTYTINNTASVPLTMAAFTNTLPAGMTVAFPPAITSSCSLNAVVTAVAGSNLISLSDGAIAASSSCTITVNVTQSAVGTHTNTTGDLTSSEGNSGTATANLTVSNTLPGFSKSFSPSTINSGERSRLTFTVDNSLNAGVISNLDFTDHLPAGMVVASPANVVFTCGNALIPPTVTANPGSSTITLDANGNATFPALAAAASCTVSVDVIATGAVDLNNVTADLLANFVSSGKASDVLEMNPIAGLFIDKTFVTNPVSPSGTTDVVYTIKNFSRSSSATAISFTDDLTFLTGLVATGTATNNCSISMTGTSVLSFTGGALAPGASCTITVPLQIPAGALSGTYLSTTTAISGVVDGNPVTGNTTTEALYIQSGPIITKTFLNNPVAPGGTTTLEFTITNTDPSNALTDASFTDDLTGFLGYFPIGVSLPASGSCGGGSTFIMTVPTTDQHVFVMAGGTIAPGSSCTFSIDIDILAGLPGGTYTNTTSSLSGTLDGISVLGLPASDDLEVIAVAVPDLRISFTDDPVNAGDTVNLEFTISYDESGAGPASDVGFTLDLDAVIPGLVATGTSSSCGGSISGTNVLTYSGGIMAPGDVCTFNVPVQVPAGAIPGAYEASTSNLTATVDGLTQTGNMATDDLIIGGLSVTHEFINNPVPAGELTTLRFTIDNTTTFNATDVAFFDSLGSVLSGLMAEAPLPVSICGGSVTGTSSLNYSGGSVDAGTSCTFDVNVRVPAGAVSGSYTNFTSNVTAILNGSNLILPSTTSNLVVNDFVDDDNLLLLTKSFTNDPVVPGDNVTLEYTLTNLDPINAVTSIAFTDDFGQQLAGLERIGSPATECGGGEVNGASLLSFTGGSLAGGASCSFSVTLTTSAATPYGTIITSTTSDITGSAGGLEITGSPASDNLLFQSLSLTKSIAGPVEPGATTVITFTITNDDLVNAINQISFTDDLDAFIPGMVATILPAAETCGTLSEVTGTSLLTFSRGSLESGTSCSFDVTVLVPCDTADNTYTNTTSTITGDGSYTNLEGDIIVLALEAPAASADLTVNSLGNVLFSAPDDLCIDAGVQVGLGGGTPVGGVYSGSGVSDSGDGLTYSFDPVVAGIGSHPLTYTYTNINGCLNSAIDDIVVNDLPLVTLTGDIFCIDAAPANLEGSPVDGAFSGDGITDGVAGTFDPAIAGAGTHTITYEYTDANGCSNSATADVIVNDLPVVSVSGGPFCIDAVPSNLTGSPVGGTFSGIGITDGVAGTFDPATAGVGTHIITYEYTDANGCSNSATTDVIVNDLPVVSVLGGSFCLDDTPTNLVGSPVGGTFSGMGIADGVAGTFDPATAGVGTHLITYVFTDTNGCSESATVDVIVNDAPVVAFTALDDLCVDAGIQVGLGGGTPAQGTEIGDLGVYSGDGVTDDGNGITYSFNPALAGAGINSVTYAYTNSNGCTNSASDDVEVFALPIVMFTPPSDPLCPDTITSGLGGGTPLGGVYSGPGVSDDGNGMTYSFDSSVSGIGTFTLTYEFIDANTCGNSASDTVTVSSIIPNVEITYSVLPDFCQGNGALLTAESENAISYSWNTGETTEVIEVSVDGTYGVTITTSAGCTASAEYVLSGFDSTDLTAVYTMIAQEEIYLKGNNTVLTGGLGVLDSENETILDGNIKIQDFSEVTGFAKAARIEIDATSSVGSTILSPADVPIPTFLSNSESNNGSPDVTVEANQVMTLSGDVYDKVQIKEGATVIFTESNIFIDELKTHKDITIEFSGCTYLYINKNVKFEKNTTFNTLGNKVVMYADKKIEIKEGGYFNANLYSNNQDIKVNGKSDNPTKMIGMFIAQKIKGDDFVNWEMNTSCINCPPPTGQPFVLGEANLVDIASSVMLYPNPAEDYVILNNPNNLVLETLDIFDLRGRIIKSVNLENMGTEKSINISGLESATYFIRIQGVDEQLMKKLVIE